MSLVRLSLQDGSIVNWYQASGSFTIAGFDADNHPILAVFGQSVGAPTGSLSLLKAPNLPVVIKATGGSFLAGQGRGLTDAHGTWFGSADGSIWLYTSAGDFEKVASVPPQPGGNGQPYDPHAWRSVAGPCL